MDSVFIDLTWNETPLISPAELIDKHTILSLKLVSIGKDISQATEHEEVKQLQDKQSLIFDEINRTDYILTKIYKHFNYDNERLSELIKELSISNKKQWEAEDKVRKDKTATAALEARKCNNYRVSLKNQINELFNYPTEVKNYK